MRSLVDKVTALRQDAQLPDEILVRQPETERRAQLNHRFIPRPMSEYVTAIVTPLGVAPAVERRYPLG